MISHQESSSDTCSTKATQAQHKSEVYQLYCVSYFDRECHFSQNHSAFCMILLYFL